MAGYLDEEGCVKYRHTIADTFRFAEQKSCVDGWRGAIWKRNGDDSSTVSGGVYGSSTEYSDIVVTDAELDEWAEAYERSSGKCYECKGSQLVTVGWSRERGRMTEKCKLCADGHPNRSANSSAVVA